MPNRVKSRNVQLGAIATKPSKINKAVMNVAELFTKVSNVICIEEKR